MEAARGSRAQQAPCPTAEQVHNFLTFAVGEYDVDPKSIEDCTNPPAVDVKLTIYPGVGHESWPPVYAVTDPAVDIYAWMLSHPKP